MVEPITNAETLELPPVARIGANFEEADRLVPRSERVAAVQRALNGAAAIMRAAEARGFTLTVSEAAEMLRRSEAVAPLRQCLDRLAAVREVFHQH